MCYCICNYLGLAELLAVTTSNVSL